MKTAEQALHEMLGMMANGEWIRDTVGVAGRRAHCALGMIHMAASNGESASSAQDRDGFTLQQELYKLLDSTIPKEELRALPPAGHQVNGGTVRCHGSDTGRIASYNNTRKDESEIVDWYTRALELAKA